MLYRGPMGGGAASGAVGSLITSHCAQGQYLKSRVKSVNPRSAFQHPLRNAIRQLAPRWQEVLTDSQRAAWNTYAANVTWTNRLGDTVHLSGQMEFIRSNAARQLGGGAFIDDGPTTFNRGDIGTPGTLTMGLGDALFTLTVDPAVPWLDGNIATHTYMWLGLPRSGAIRFFKRRTRFVDIIPGTAAGGVHVFSFGQWPPPSYNQAWTLWYAASFADGRLTTPIQTNVVTFGPPPPPFWSEPFDYADGPLNGNADWTDTGSTGNFWTISTFAAQSPVGPNATAACITPPLQTFNLDGHWVFTATLQRNLGTDPGNTLDLQLGGVFPSASPSLYLIQLVWAPGDGALDQIDHFSVLDPHGDFNTITGPFPFTLNTDHTLQVEHTSPHLFLTLDGTPIGSITLTPAPATFGFQMQWENLPTGATVTINSLLLEP